MIQNNIIQVVKQSDDFSHGLCVGDMVKISKIDILKTEPITIPFTVYSLKTYFPLGENEGTGYLWVEMDGNFFSSYGFKCYYTFTSTYYNQSTNEEMYTMEGSKVEYLLEPLKGTVIDRESLPVFPIRRKETIEDVWTGSMSPIAKVVTEYSRGRLALFNKYTGEEQLVQYSYNHPSSSSSTTWNKTEDSFSFSGCENYEIVT